MSIGRTDLPNLRGPTSKYSVDVPLLTVEQFDDMRRLGRHPHVAVLLDELAQCHSAHDAIGLLVPRIAHLVRENAALLRLVPNAHAATRRQLLQEDSR